MTISDRYSGPNVVIDRKGVRQAKISNACRSVFSASYAKVPRLQHLPKDANIAIMMKYINLRVQSEVARKKNRAYDINKMSKTFEMTISRLRFLNSLCRIVIIFARPEPRSTTTSHILKSSIYFDIIILKVPILAVPIL